MRNVLLSELFTQAHVVSTFVLKFKYKSFSSEKNLILQNLVLSYNKHLYQ